MTMATILELDEVYVYLECCKLLNNNSHLNYMKVKDNDPTLPNKYQFVQTVFFFLQI